jgi:hypothetical protein
VWTKGAVFRCVRLVATDGHKTSYSLSVSLSFRPRLSELLRPDELPLNLLLRAIKAYWKNSYLVRIEEKYRWLHVEVLGMFLCCWQQYIRQESALLDWNGNRLLVPPPVSVCLQISARFPVDGFEWNLILRAYMKCRQIPNLVKNWHIFRELYMKT